MLLWLITWTGGLIRHHQLSETPALRRCSLDSLLGSASQVHEFFGDFVVVDPHHFAVPIARLHIAMQVPSFTGPKETTSVNMHIAGVFSRLSHTRPDSVHMLCWPSSWAHVTQVCLHAAALQLGLRECHRRGQPHDRGPGIADALAQEAVRHQVPSLLSSRYGFLLGATVVLLLTVLVLIY